VAKTEISAALQVITWLGVSLIAILLTPLVVAETIPKDRQIGVRELLDTLPLPSAIYLLGKLLSVWLTLLVGVGLAALISGGVWWVWVGPFPGGQDLAVWGGGAVLLILINAGSGLLLAAGQPTTRRAILVAGGYVLLCLVGLIFIFSPEVSLWSRLNPARPAVMLYYLLGSQEAGGNDILTRGMRVLVQQVASRGEVLTALGVGLGQVGLLWLIVWLWLRKKSL
jgi:hypothetical protein